LPRGLLRQFPLRRRMRWQLLGCCNHLSLSIFHLMAGYFKPLQRINSPHLEGGYLFIGEPIFMNLILNIFSNYVCANLIPQQSGQNSPWLQNLRFTQREQSVHKVSIPHQTPIRIPIPLRREDSYCIHFHAATLLLIRLASPTVLAIT